ncbi:MAG TPA: enoyl-CoA hydratase [Stellaceae bacterium]|nr:enoyl-CoA hydratase [Stellaceae bacterium]
MITDKMLMTKDGAIGRMVFNNPARHNAVSLEMWEGAETIIDDLASDPEIRVIVVSGAGGKAFVSGADISKFESERASEEAVKHYNATTDRFHTKLAAITKPTIAMIRGYCIGGGVSLATGCDLRICSDNSRFGIPAARLGLGYGHKGIRKLMDLVGPASAKELFFTAKQFTAQQALMMGLVNQVVPEAELETYVDDYAKAIAENAPLTVTQIKRTVSELLKDPADRDVALMERLVAECFASEDYIEGRRAFMEKRKAQFRGR